MHLQCIAGHATVTTVTYGYDLKVFYLLSMTHWQYKSSGVTLTVPYQENSKEREGISLCLSSHSDFIEIHCVQMQESIHINGRSRASFTGWPMRKTMQLGKQECYTVIILMGYSRVDKQPFGRLRDHDCQYNAKVASVTTMMSYSHWEPRYSHTAIHHKEWALLF